MQAALAVALAAAVSFGAWRAGALTMRGAFAACVAGAAVFWAGGWPYAAVLFAFFLPSTVLSHAGRARKRASGTPHRIARNAAQVAANGGVAAVAAVLAHVFHNSACAAAFAGAFAAASADTWGTEIGMLSRGRPRSLLLFRSIATGLSGGVTAIGTVAEAAGALAVAAVASAVAGTPLVIVAIAGIAGAFIDSLLGASAQRLYQCTGCAQACETPVHACGAPARPIRGMRGFGNDTVNACATFAGAALAFGLTLAASR